MVNHGIAIVAMSPCGVGFAGGDGFGRLGTVSKVYESDRGDGSFWVKAGKGGKIYSVLTSRVEFGKRAKVVPQRYKLLCNDRPSGGNGSRMLRFVGGNGKLLCFRFVVAPLSFIACRDITTYSNSKSRENARCRAQLYVGKVTDGYKSSGGQIVANVPVFQDISYVGRWGFKKGRLPEDEARFYAAEVIDALEYIHNMGLIHRDIKMIPSVVVKDVKRDVKLLQALSDHENVVQFCNAYVDSCYVYIVMEYVIQDANGQEHQNLHIHTLC
ncbi:3-phosphoinositide-dependent protein kinase 2 isoform X1 [Tanacetum coccineum]